ncbi:MAG: cyclophilin-like fold protein [Aristaeellaceae bacterium]
MIPGDTPAAGLALSIGGTTVNVLWEDNEAVRALADLAAEGPLRIEASRYGGFEQVGDLPRALPREDVQLNAAPGDIMLYAGNAIVVFFGTNTWAYTRLGRIKSLSEEELRLLLNTEHTLLELSLSQE